MILGLGWLAAGSAVLKAATLFDFGAAWRWRKGTAEASAPDPAAWRQSRFDDRTWSQGPAPFFYGEALTGTELPDMRGGYSTLYLRRTFVVGNPAEISALTLRALSDDGFVAWINGREVVRFNAFDGEIRFTGTSIQSFNEPLPVETFEIPGFREILVPGTNVIAVLGLNVSIANSSDFVFQAALEAAIDESAPQVSALSPEAGSRVRSLTRVTVVFDEMVEGVDASDLRVAGRPATNRVAVAGDAYVFEFPAVAAGPVTLQWAANTGIRDLSSRRNPFAGGSWSYTVDPDLPPPGVVLSEFMANNRRTLNDEDGDASDWIELRNTSDVPVDLSGWSLSDDPALPAKWRFPVVSIPARGFLVVFASGKNRTLPSGRLHTNFRLGSSGGDLRLFRADGSLASDSGGTYPPQQQDVSYGRLGTDPRVLGYFPTPTPGRANAEGGPGFAPEVEFSRIGGTFVDPFTLRLETAATGAGTATVRYTLDGSVPTPSSLAYDPLNPPILRASTRVRARSFVPGLLPGPLRGEYYVQLNPAVVGVTSTLPLVVLHSYGGGAVPPNGEYPATVLIHEPRAGVASLTNAPDLRTRARLNIRGSSTLFQAKRNYSVEFRDEREADRPLSPLGMPEESDWILYAPNNFEPILIHNPMAYRMSRDIGQYAPRTRFVEVYVQTATGALTTSSYAGIYVLMEKIKRSPDRVPIENLEPEHSKPPQVTGGYLLKIDRLDPGDGGLYAGGQQMGFVDPKEEEFALPQRAPQRNYIRDYLDRFGTALYSADWRDPVRGWRAFVDEPSWIDHHLLNVVTFNVDALRLSTYFHKPREGRLVFGPVWDFDRALFSTDGRDAEPRVWRSRTSDMGTDFFNYPWWGRMFEDPDFWQAYIDRYQSLRQAQFSTNRLFALIDELTSEVRPAQPREVARWPGFTSPRTSYANEISSLKSWLGRRLDFMDTNFPAAPLPSRGGGRISAGETLQFTVPRPTATAVVYFTLDGTDPRAPGGAVAPSARRYTGPIPLTDRLVVRARRYDPNHRNLTGPNNPPLSSPWSGPVTARFTQVPGPDPGVLLFTEIHSRPALPTAGELAANPLLTAGDFEFLELRNIGDRTVDLADLRFTAGVSFAFATSAVPRLAAGDRLVLARNTQALTLRYGTVPGLAGQYGGSLAGGGESLRIEDSTGRGVAEASFRNAWHPATDRLGFSLVAVDEQAPMRVGAGASAWRPSAVSGGSPGRADPPAPDLPRVVVNEVLAHTDPPSLDAIELVNLGDRPVDIGGWWLTDDAGAPRKYRIPNGKILPAGGAWVVDESSFGPAPDRREGFRLDSLGEGTWLFAADAAGQLLGPAHGVEFGASPNGVSFGRVPECGGGEGFVAQSAPSLGGPNSGPLPASVVISEIHYHPPDILLGTTRIDDTAWEFVEITNVGATPAPLYDPVRPTNTWHLGGTVGFVFPKDTTLPAGGTVVVVNFDPERNPQALAGFRSALGVAAGARLLGPLQGRLENSGGRVELFRPDVPQTAADPSPGLVPAVSVDRVVYSDEVPWPKEADGMGRSLQRIYFEGPGSDARAWVALAPSPGTLPPARLDSDGDRLPDAWEAAHCLDPLDPTDALADADGDLSSNRDEYVAGTDPSDPTDRLAWEAVIPGPDGFSLRFRARAGRAYRIEVAEGVSAGIWRRLQELPVAARDEVLTVLDPEAGGGTAPRFYRIVLPVQP